MRLQVGRRRSAPGGEVPSSVSAAAVSPARAATSAPPGPDHEPSLLGGRARSFDALHALEAALGGSRFWNPHTLSELPSELVGAYLSRSLQEEGAPALLVDLVQKASMMPLENRLWWLRNSLPRTGGSRLPRILAFQAGLPLELLMAPIQGGKLAPDPSISWVPGIKVNGLDLRKSSVESLDPGLQTKEDLRLEGSRVAHLPDGLVVGSLLLRSTPIRALPKGLVVGEYLDIRGLPIQTLPSDLQVGHLNGVASRGALDAANTPLAALPDEEIRRMAPGVIVEILR